MLTTHLSLLNKCYGICRDALLATSESQLLGSGGLDANLIGVAANNVSHGLLHLWNMWIHLGTLRTDGSIDVNQVVALGGNEFNGFLQNNLAVVSSEVSGQW